MDSSLSHTPFAPDEAGTEEEPVAEAEPALEEVEAEPEPAPKRSRSRKPAATADTAETQEETDAAELEADANAAEADAAEAEADVVAAEETEILDSTDAADETSQQEGD